MIFSINPNEVAIVRCIFEYHLNGDSFSNIAMGLELQGTLSPTGKSKWSREAINELLSNENYTGRVLLQSICEVMG